MPLGMKYSLTGLHLTESFEGLKFEAYPDQGGVWTIARGHTRGVSKGLTCIAPQADAWTFEDLGFAEAAANDLVTVVLTQGEFDSLVDFIFNLGTEKFKGSTLLRLLNSGNYSGAAAEFDKWDYVAGKQCAGLLRRREEETKEFEGV